MIGPLFNFISEAVSLLFRRRCGPQIILASDSLDLADVRFIFNLKSLARSPDSSAIAAGRSSELLILMSADVRLILLLPSSLVSNLCLVRRFGWEILSTFDVPSCRRPINDVSRLWSGLPVRLKYC